MAGTASSRSASSSTMIAFFPPISQTTFLSCGWRRLCATGGLPDAQPDFARAGKCDQGNFRMLDEGRSDFCSGARQAVKGLGWNARLVKDAAQRLSR